MMTIIIHASPPLITSLSLRIENEINVRGSTSATGGFVEAYSMGVWKGIADVLPDGTFSNPNLPESYLLSQDAISVRVSDAGAVSQPVVATNNFVHPRAMWINPTATKSADQEFYQWRIQWADYQPTGYLLPAGETASIWLEGDDAEVWVCVGIQGMANRLDRTTQTENMRQTRLKRGHNIIPVDVMGGVIHIRNNNQSGGRCHLTLDHKCRPIPYYQLGSTSQQDFAHMLSASDSLSEVQLVGDRVVISAYADTYRRFAHPDAAEIVRSHEQVLNIQVQASGLDGSIDKHTRSSMWIHAVESASTRSPHATTGYIALPHGKDANSEYMKSLVGGLAHKLWVTLHEYGHHFQTRTNSTAPMFGENTVNIYALAVGRVYENNYSEEFPKRWPALRAWLARPREQKKFMESPDTQAIFEQLRKGFGDSYLPNWDRFSREYPSIKNDLINFTTSLSIVADANLADFFADWGVIVQGDAVWQALSVLGLPHAPNGLTAHVPYT